MSKYYQQLQLYLFKNKLNEKSLINFMKDFSDDTIKHIISDLKINNEKCDVKDQLHKLYIFSDGNVKGNGKKYARGGYSVYFGEEEKYKNFNKTRIFENEPTNNKMELFGIKQIYKTIYKNQDIFKNMDNIICTDSQYSISCITQWVDIWIKNNWKNSKGEVVKNKELIEEILIIKNAMPDDIKISFKHVYGHTKEPKDKDSLEYKVWYGNNRVDTDINKMLENNSFKK
jgi:ribonuclease HI